MTNNLKCHFCGAELTGWREKHLGEFWACGNYECPAFGKLKGNFGMWQAIIDGKAAQDALKEIKETVDEFKDSEFSEDMRDCVRSVSRIIASITTQEKE